MAETEIASQDYNEDLQSAKLSSSNDGDGFPELPSRAVEDLFSLGVCGRCVLRLFGIRWDQYSRSSMPSSIVNYVFGDVTNSEKHKMNAISEENQTSCNEVDTSYCSLCFGILQFAYCDDNGSVVCKGSAHDFAASIADLVKQEGYQVDKFSLEVSVPPVIQENDLSICLSMKKKYACDMWFQSKGLPQLISVKDSLKSSITGPLEKLLDCKSNASTLRIRLTYSHPQLSTTAQSFIEKNQGSKRRKTVFAAGNSLETDDGSVKCSDFPTGKVDKVVDSFLETRDDGQLSDQVKFTLEKVSKPCKLVFQCNRTNIYFGGRYLKFSRNVSQTRWIIDDERMGEASVEELIGSKILPMCHGDNYKFHAAGREDIDVRMLGSGRPFLVEVQNAHRIPSEEGVKELEKRINDSENKLVGVKNLKIVGSQGWTMMREGESEKQKQYAALVWISRPLEDEDFQSIASYKEMLVLQKTPIRVLHRRSPLQREKIIHWMRMEKIVGSAQYFLLHLCTQAGTYIKEFVHGDLGRTHPSIGSILGCRAEIQQLDVTDVKMDCFLDE